MIMMMMMPQVIRANRFHFKPLKYSTYWHTDVGHYSPHVLFQVYYKPRGLVKASKYLLLWLFTHVEQSNRSTRTRSRTRTRTSTRTRTDTHFERLCVRNSQQRAALGRQAAQLSGSRSSLKLQPIWLLSSLCTVWDQTTEFAIRFVSY